MTREDSPADAPTVEAEEAGTKDSFDEVLVKIVRTPTDALAVGTELADRFRIERVLGSGGMGTVYAARDRSLDRAVAIKVHHHAGGAGRLRREAIAMARLAHPNVVTVFEVGELERRPFVVMELVPGTTMREWLAAAPRKPREILAMLVGAGEGLAAAHAAGLVHRDFKPENVLIGSDGRPRVSDFGLARGLDSQDEQPGAPSGDIATSMTVSGAVLGTPAYMAPEQIAGAAVDARADQFSFCVTAWEALYGQRPFPGANLELLRAAIESGARLQPPAGVRVPARVRAALDVGLAIDPADRFPTMGPLLDALRPRRTRARWAVAGGAVVAVAGTIAFVATRGGHDSVTCTRAADRVAEVWNARARGAVASAFDRSGRPGAATTLLRVTDILDQRARDLAAARVEACEATHVRGEQSSQLLDLRMRCLDRRLGEMRALVDVLGDGGVDAVDHAIEAATRLASPATCADGDALSHEVPLPDDPVERDKIAALEHRANDLEARTAAGRYAETLPLAEAFDRDTANVAYAPLRARAASIHADLLGQLGRHVEAEPVWYAALHAASAARDDRVTLDVWRNVLDGRVASNHIAGADVIAQSALATAERLDARDRGRALLDETLAALGAKQGNNDDAVAHARKALAWFTQHVPGSLDEADATVALAGAFYDHAEFPAALDANGKAIAMLEPVLGTDHPRIARLHQSRSLILMALSRFDDARTELANLVAPIEKAYGPTSIHRGRLAFAMGELDRKLARSAEATADYKQALAIYERAGTDVEVAQALVGLGANASDAGHAKEARDYLTRAKAAAEHALPESERLLSGILVYDAAGMSDLRAAQTELERALEIRARLFGPESIFVGEVENTLGANYTWLGDHAQAMTHLRHAVAIHERTGGPNAFNTAIAHNNLGIELADQDDNAGAVAEHERALAALERAFGPQHPTLTAPLSMLAYEYAAIGRAPDGVAAAERAHAIHAARKEPDDAQLNLGWGAALWDAGKDRARAVALVRAAVAEWKKAPDDPAALKRAEAWLASHR
jgi:tetratricopeptide (TPR) repeat protein